MNGSRRGVAMIAALWLVVGISVVALEFSLVGQERRAVGLAGVDRVHGGAGALGAFAMTRARLEYALRTRVQGGGANAALSRIRSFDPWLDADSLYGGTIAMDSMSVDVEVVDLGTRLNINVMPEVELRTFLSYTLGDFVLADELAQSILDWRDQDDIARARGGEVEEYLKLGYLRLPANQQFRDVEELLDVKGVTPDIYARISPFLTTMGAAQVNLNTAPVEVLRAIPGMTDDVVMNIVNLRSRGARIANVNEVLPRGAAAGGGQTVVRAGAGGGVEVIRQQQQNQLGARAAVQSNQLMLVMITKASHASHPVRLRVLLQRSVQNGQPAADVMSEDWR